MPAFIIARQMGARVDQIEKTNAHLLPDAADAKRARLDAFDAAQNPAFGHGTGTVAR